MIISKSKFKHIPEAWEMMQEISDILAEGGDELSQVDQIRSVVKALDRKLDVHFSRLLGPLDGRIERALRIMDARGINETLARRSIDHVLEACGEDVKAAELASFAIAAMNLFSDSEPTSIG